MKYMTKKNIEKATNIIMNKGYDKNTAENMAINCFCLAQQFNGKVEDWIMGIEDKCKSQIVE